MWELGALRITDEAEVLDHVVDAGGTPLNRLAGVGDMLDTLLPGLQQVDQEGNSEGVCVGLIVRDGWLGLDDVAAETARLCRAGVCSFVI